MLRSFLGGRYRTFITFFNTAKRNFVSVSNNKHKFKGKIKLLYSQEKSLYTESTGDSCVIVFYAKRFG